MRTTTTAQDIALASKYRSTHMRVQIDRGSSDWVNLGDFMGYNWVDSVDYAIDEDNPVQRATIKLVKKIYDLNLAPLLDGSKLNQQGVIADIGNPIIIEVAVLGQDVEPAASDWVEVHRGEIDDVDWSGDRITINARDDGGRLVDTFIETQEAYGSIAGTAMEDVIQDILDDHATSTTYLYSVNGTDAGLPASAFNAGDSPGFNIVPYSQDQVSIMAAIRQIAQLIGADVGYKWHANTSAFQLLFQQPDREIAAVGAITLTGNIAASDDFTIDATNLVEGVDFNRGSDKWASASAMADAINADSTLSVSCTATYDNSGSNPVVYVTWGELGTAGNAITFTENLTNATMDGGGTLGGTIAGDNGNTTADYTFDSDAYYSISSLKISRQDIRNVVEVVYQDPDTLDTRSATVKSDASVTKYGRRYMKLTEASGSQIDTMEEALTFAGSALADLQEPTMDKSVTMPYFWPAEIGDVYTFAANGDHYDSDQTLSLCSVRHSLTRTSARSTMTVRGKPSGGRKRWLKIEGRPGVAPVSIEKIGPYHESSKTQSFDQLLRNADLNIFTKGKGLPPDHWSVVSPDEWGSGNEVYYTTGAVTGDYAITVDVDSSNSAVAVQSAYLAVAPGDLHRIGILAQGDVAESSTDVDLEVRYYDAQKNYLSSGGPTGVTLNNGSFEARQSALFEAPASTRFCTVRVTVNYVDSDYVATFDRISMVRELPRWNEYAFNTTGGSAALVTLNFNNAGSFEAGCTWTDSTDAITITIPGTYTILVRSQAAYNAAAASAFLYTVQLQIDTGSGYAAVAAVNAGSTQPNPGGRASEANAVINWMAVLNVGDKLRVQGQVTNVTPGAAANVNMNAYPNSSFQGQMLTRADR